jgi:hypothetical protein
MAIFLPDTNILIGYGRTEEVQKKLENARQDGSIFILAPPVLTELVRGILARNGDKFESDRAVFVFIQGCTILDLPIPFLQKTLGAAVKQRSRVEPKHYQQLIDTIVDTQTFQEFLEKSKAPGSVWAEIDQAHPIHETQLDKEIGSLHVLAQRTAQKNLVTRMTHNLGIGTGRAEIAVVAERCSAGLELMEASLSRVKATTSSTMVRRCCNRW